MERPGVVWAYTILVVLGIIFVLFIDIPLLMSEENIYVPVVAYYLAILSLLALIPTIFFIYMFFMLKKKSLTWLYISFGLSLIINIVNKAWITSVIIIIFGWVVWDYIRNKRLSGNPVFT